jgi:hypothetical protein
VNYKHVSPIDRGDGCAVNGDGGRPGSDRSGVRAIRTAWGAYAVGAGLHPPPNLARVVINTNLRCLTCFTFGRVPCLSEMKRETGHSLITQGAFHFTVLIPSFPPSPFPPLVGLTCEKTGFSPPSRREKKSDINLN